MRFATLVHTVAAALGEALREGGTLIAGAGLYDPKEMPQGGFQAVIAEALEAGERDPRLSAPGKHLEVR